MTWEMKKMVEREKSVLRKYGGLMFIVAIIVIFILLAATQINFGQWLANSVIGFYDAFGDIGIYIGVFIISIFGNFTFSNSCQCPASNGYLSSAKALMVIVLDSGE